MPLGHAPFRGYKHGMRGRWLGCAILVLAVVGGTAVWLRYQGGHRVYDRVILTASERYGVDPALIKAVIWQESRFQAAVRGQAGEFGLMQIRDEAALEWAGAERLSGFEPEHLLDPGTNTLAGTWYLRRLLLRYGHTDNPIPYALADYNAGRTRVLRWLKGPAATNSVAFLGGLDFPGTRRYVENIMEQHARYRLIFRAPRPERPKP